ncbi:MAG: helix-turn-helix transcriptional regulator [Eubacteriales bacterium]|nr:helix-turn-helix transcriptional regulator [Eubacteriales bacterium]MDD4475896.1 helix-turn-helix transcriptional regulator [Eubacteriales bacterium]
MFDTKKFGGYLSRLRKNADMTQSELAEKLAVTRQAVSGYERGDSFPDVSILVIIADVFGISLDDLINSGEPTRGEALILSNTAVGNNNVIAESVADIVNLAPLLKPSILEKLSAGLSKKGIDISNIVSLAEYLNDDSVVSLLKNATFDTISDDLLEKLMPLLDDRSKGTIFQKILEGEMDWHLVKSLIPYADYLQSQVEAAVVEGALPYEALDLMHQGRRELWEKLRRNGELTY